MTVCLSANGVNVHSVDAAPTRLLVATLGGVTILDRDAPGASWRTQGLVLEGKHASALMVEPTRGGIFAGVHDGALYFSGDDGETWQQRSDGITIPHIYSLAYAPRAGGATLYAGTEPVGLFRSDDYGRSWRDLAAIRSMPGREKWSFPGPPHVPHVKSIAVHPRDPDTVYAAVEQGGLMKSTDGGASFRELDAYAREGDAVYHDIHRTLALPSRPDEMFMTSGCGLYRSTDAGETWEHLTTDGFRVGYPDHLVVSPRDEQVMFMSGAVGNPFTWRKTGRAEGTVMRTRDGGRSWDFANRGMPPGRANVEAMGIASYPGGFSLFAGNTDGEVYCSEDGGENWTRIASGLKPVSKGAHYRLVQGAPAAAAPH